MIIDLTGKWPYPDLRFVDGDDWAMIDAEHADSFLNAVPPIYLKHGGFMVGEASRHTSAGIPVYLTIFPVGSRFFAKELAADVARDRGHLLLLGQLTAKVLS